MFICIRYHVNLFFKQVNKIAWIIETAAQTDLQNRQVFLLHQIYGLGNPIMIDMFNWCFLKGFLKKHKKL